MSPLREILIKDDNNEDGMLTIFSFFTLVFLFALAVLVGNVMTVVNRKIEVQNAADAVALSAGTQMARGLNEVTAINHLMGELLALVVLHNGLGGDQLSDTRDRDLPEDNLLDAAQQAAQGAGASTFAHKVVGKKMKADGALLDAWRDLKRALTTLYTAQAAAKALEKIPLVGAAGTALYSASLPLEAYMAAEGTALQALYAVAKATNPIARLIFRQGLDGLGSLARDARFGAPRLANSTAREIGTRNNVEGTVAPNGQELRLGVVPDPTPAGAGDEQMGRSQAVRAAWPWVAFHRQRVLQLTEWMVFSQMARHYRTHTERFMLSKARELYTRPNGRFLMLSGSQPDRKGEESWTDNSAQLDGLFAVLGLAHQDAPAPWGPTLYRQHNEEGLVCFAQALVYNANPQQQRRQDAQPALGWDTLNWAPPGNGADFTPPEYPRDPTGDGSPMIRPNWQVKLVPVSGTMLRKASNGQTGRAARAMRRVDPDSQVAHTH